MEDGKLLFIGGQHDGTRMAVDPNRGAYMMPGHQLYRVEYVACGERRWTVFVHEGTPMEQAMDMMVANYRRELVVGSPGTVTVREEEYEALLRLAQDAHKLVMDSMVPSVLPTEDPEASGMVISRALAPLMRRVTAWTETWL